MKYLYSGGEEVASLCNTILPPVSELLVGVLLETL